MGGELFDRVADTVGVLPGPSDELLGAHAVTGDSNMLSVDVERRIDSNSKQLLSALPSVALSPPPSSWPTSL